MKRNSYSIFMFLLVMPLMIGCSSYPYFIKEAPTDITKRPYD